MQLKPRLRVDSTLGKVRQSEKASRARTGAPEGKKVKVHFK